MDITCYFLLSILSLFIDQIILYFNYSIYSVFLFINLVGLHLIIQQIEIDINIRYGPQNEGN